jgi:hypothetical protein
LAKPTDTVTDESLRSNPPRPSTSPSMTAAPANVPLSATLLFRYSAMVAFATAE